MLKRVLFSWGLLFLMTTAVLAEDRYIQQLSLANGMTVVVAEGDFEARSIGSFSLRLYERASKGDETTFFVNGLILPRDGTIEEVVLADIDGDGIAEIIVVIRSVGSGAYLSTTAFSLSVNQQLEWNGSVDGLAPNEDYIAKLRQYRAQCK